MLKAGMGDVSWIFATFYNGVFPLSEATDLYYTAPNRDLSLANDSITNIFHPNGKMRRCSGPIFWRLP